MSCMTNDGGFGAIGVNMLWYDCMASGSYMDVRFCVYCGWRIETVS